MRSRRLIVACVALVASSAVPPVVRAQGASARKPLHQMSATDRAAQEYQRTAWLASVQLMATNPDLSQVQRYVAYHADSGWVVAFGRLNTARDTFYVSQIAVPAVVNGQRVDSVFEFHKFEQPGPDVDYLVRASLAIDTAVAAMGTRYRPYRAAAIPEENGDWLVYLTPAGDDATTTRSGEDVRFHISADADRVLEMRRVRRLADRR